MSSVEKICQEFTEKWNKYLIRNPLLVLDGTWPSVGTLDLLTFHLRLRPELTPNHQKLIQGVAAYLAQLASRIWKTYGGQTETFLGQSGVAIIYQDNDLKFEIQIERELKNFLKNLPSPLPVIGEFERMVSFDYNMLSLFGLGIVTGLTPVGEGAWESFTIKDFKKNLELAQIELAKSCAEYYARVFPAEPIGQVGELYLRNLILPPTMASEVLPSLVSCASLLEFAKDYGLKNKDLSKLAKNLAQFPDEAISTCGLTVFCALCDTLPPFEILAAGNSRGRYTGLLRKALNDSRELLELGFDWTNAAEITESELMRYEIERRCGFLPWIFLSKSRVKLIAKQPVLKVIFNSLVEYDLEGAVGLLDKVLELEPGDIDLRLQKIFLQLSLGDVEGSEKAAKNLISEPEAEGNARVFDLAGLVMLAKNEPEQALKLFKKAALISGTNPIEKSDIDNNIGWTLMIGGDFETAITHLKTALKDALSPITILLNLSHCYYRLGFEKERIEIEAELFRIAPTDRRVFASIIATEALEGV